MIGVVIRYRPDIDGLRALAILGVVGYHVGLPHLTGGYAGVDVFFVVSGYLIMQLLAGEYEREGRVDFRAFYERRARRLLPALALVVLATLLLGFVLLPFPGARTQLGESAIAALLFVANRWFALKTGGYFVNPVERMPLVHTWSLAVEEQFYLIFPLLLLAVSRLAAPEHRVRSLRRAIGLISAASFVLGEVLVLQRPAAAFYSASARAWEIGVGALIALWPVRPPAGIPLLKTLAVPAGLAMIALSFVALRPASPFPGVLALLPVTGSALVVMSSSSAGSLLTRGLSIGPLVALGRVSYAWYLWHWPLLSIARLWRLGEKNLAADTGWALLALLLAILTTKFVEFPIRRPREVAPGVRRRVATLAAMTVGALLMLSVVLVETDRFRSSGLSRLDIAPPPDPCLVGSWNARLTFGRCAAEPAPRGATVVVWGDSFGDAWAPMVRDIGAAESVTVLQVTRNGCPPLLDFDPPPPNDVDKDCRPVNRAVADYLRLIARRGPAGVVLAARWPRLSLVRPAPRPTVASNEPRDPAPADALQAGLERTLAFADSLRIRVVVLLTPPEFPYALPDCLIVRADVSCGVTRAQIDRYRRPSLIAIRQAALAHPGSHIVDPIGFFCDGNFCPPVVHGVLALRDADHVSASAAHAFAPSMRADFLWLVAPR